MAGRFFSFTIIAVLALSCSADRKMAEPKKPAPVVLVKPRPQTLAPEQRAELGFPAEVISQVEAAAGAEAEPFFETVFVRAENLKGEKGFEQNRLAGFSVRTKNADEIVSSLSRAFRRNGYLIFKSRQNYGNVPDVVTVIKGNNSYDILKVQKTEAPNYHLNTKAIIRWLREQQKQAPFVITGASADWVEARFVRPPGDMHAFAKKVYAFSPDVVAQGARTIDKLAEQMKRSNGFYLMWD